MSKWQNRIIGTGEADPKQLTANPINFRKHPKRQQDAINGSLDALGWIQTVIVNKRTGRIIDGHLRVDQAIAHGESSVPVQWVDLSEAEEGQALLSLDPIAAMAETNKQAMTDILKQINETQEMLAPYLEDIGKSNNIDMSDIFGKDEDDPPDESQAETFREKWGVESGHLWELGEHRVVCGDCTDMNSISKVIGQKQNIIVITDPPYGINVVGGGGPTKFGKVGGGGPTKFGKVGGCNIVNSNWYEPVANDDTIETGQKFYESCIDYGIDKYIIWGGNYFTSFLPPSRCWLIWDKQNTGNFADAELAWTSFDKSVKLYQWLWNGLSRKGDRKTEGIKRFHPTQKPVGLHSQIIYDFSKKDEIIFDGFLGSGTTLIACENLHRKCRGIEISPEYVAVTIERWHRLTGKTPHLLQ